MEKILFVGEGPTDVGADGVTSILSLPLAEERGDGSRPNPRGVIPILVLRCLAEHRGSQALSLQAKSAFLRRMHGRGSPGRPRRPSPTRSIRRRVLSLWW
jgi:hypothetical protein